MEDTLDERGFHQDPERDADPNPQSDSSTAEQPATQSSPDSQPAGGTAGGGKPPETVPLERFKEVEGQLKKLEPLSRLASLVNNEEDIAAMQATLMRRRLGIPDEPAAQAQPPVQGNPDADSAAVDKFVESVTPAFTANPVKTSLALAKAVAQREAQAAAAPVANLVVGLSIQNFKAEISAHPMFRLAAPIFDVMVSKIPRESLHSKNDVEMRSILQMTWRAAVGQAMMDAMDDAIKTGKIKPNATQQPPNYGAGAGGGQGGGGSKYGKLTEDEIAAGKRLGLNEEDLVALGKE